MSWRTSPTIPHSVRYLFGMLSATAWTAVTPPGGRSLMMHPFNDTVVLPSLTPKVGLADQMLLLWLLLSLWWWRWWLS
jgi:hypothetical protein